MNYNELFDLIYSTRINESLKDTIINKLEYSPIIEEINECSSEVEACIQLVDTLVESNITEETMFSVLDETFSYMNEEFINEVLGEYVKRKADEYMKKRAYDKAASNVIGLGGTFKKAEEAGDAYDKAREATQAAKASNGSALDKLKSAAGKVKDWYNKRNVATYDDVRHAIGRTAAENEGKGKPNFSSSTVVTGDNNNNNKQSSASNNTSSATPNSASTSSNNQANSTPNGQRKRSEKSENAIQKIRLERRKLKAQKRAEREAEAEEKRQRHERNEQVKAAIKQRRAGNSTPSGSDDSDNLKNFKDAVQKIRLERRKLKAQKRLEKENNNNKKPAETEAPTEVKKESEIENPKSKQEMTDAEKESKKAQQRMQRDLAQARKGKEQALKNAQEKYNSMISRPGYPKKEAEDLKNRISELEASLKESCIVDLISLLGNTNISESSFVEIMELFAPNKGNASKVKKKHDNEFNNAIDTLSTEVTNNEVNPETIQKVNNAGERKAKFDEMFRKRFGKS